jgi:hypothetical protein
MLLARGGEDNAARARTYIEGLAAEILTDPPTERSHILPLWMYLICIRVMQLQGDPQTAQTIARAGAELHQRCERIIDPSLQAGYLNVPEHRAIAAFESPS